MKVSDIKKCLAELSPETLKGIIDLVKWELNQKRKLRGFEPARGFEDKVNYMPRRATPGSGGYDIWPLEDVRLEPGEEHVFYTGIKAYMAQDEILLINIRSSYGIKHGIELCNEQGWIDADYYSNPDNDGVIIIKVKNSGPKTVLFKKNEPFAQGLFITYLLTSDDNPRLDSRCGGLGHSSEKI